MPSPTAATASIDSQTLLNLTDEELCPICKSSKRDKHRVCVVEEARDNHRHRTQRSLERPLPRSRRCHQSNGCVGPDQLHIKELLARIDEEGIEEIILALNASVEGEATTLYLISQLHTKDVKVSRIAQGLFSRQRYQIRRPDDIIARNRRKN